MSYLYTTITYSGLALDAFMTDDQQAWLTLSSLASGLGIHRQTVADWLKYHCKSQHVPIDVKVGKYKKAAKAYPTELAVEFVDFMADKGNKEAKALRTSTLKADLDRSIREANGILVTAAQHEEVRHNTRLALLQQWVADNYQAVRPSKFANYNRLEESEMVAAGFTDPVEQRILGMEAYIKKTRQFLLDNPEMSEEQQGYYTDGIRSHEKQVQTLAQSLSN